MDELRIYSTALTPNEVKALFETPSGIVHEGNGIAYLEKDNHLTGWARALMGKSANWDGWIKLSGDAQDGAPYGIYLNDEGEELEGWMYGGDVIGWISASCKNRGTCGSIPYSVHSAL